MAPEAMNVGVVFSLGMLAKELGVLMRFKVEEHGCVFFLRLPSLYMSEPRPLPVAGADHALTIHEVAEVLTALEAHRNCDPDAYDIMLRGWPRGARPVTP